MALGPKLVSFIPILNFVSSLSILEMDFLQEYFSVKPEMAYRIIIALIALWIFVKAILYFGIY